MTFLFSLFAAVVVWAGRPSCQVNLIGTQISTAQAEFTRDLVQMAFPKVRRMTLSRIDDFGPALRQFGSADFTAFLLGEVLKATLSNRTKTDETPLARALQAMRRVSRDGRKLSVCLLNEGCSDQINLMVLSRAVSLSGEGGRDLTQILYERNADGPAELALLLLQPDQLAKASPAFLSLSLVRAAASLEVSTAVIAWIEANAKAIKSARGLFKYVKGASGAYVVDTGFFNLLLRSQMAAAEFEFDLSRTRVRIAAKLSDEVSKMDAGTLKLAREISPMLRPSELMEWSQDVMMTILEQTALPNN